MFPFHSIVAECNLMANLSCFIHHHHHHHHYHRRRRRHHHTSTTPAAAALFQSKGRRRTRLLSVSNFSHSHLQPQNTNPPPRWFSPLDSGCPSRLPNFPLLLYLPGIAGTGLGLSLHHRRLGEMFDIWCLHIPATDTTPFPELVKLVESTVKSEHYQSPERPIYLVGQSFGACLALAVAARNPGIDILLVLANSATSFDGSRLRPLIPLLEAMLKEFGVGLHYMLNLITGMASTVASETVEKRPSQQINTGLSEALLALFSELPDLPEVFSVETLLWKLRLLDSASSYTNSRLHAVKSQTLILSSGRDQLLPSRQEGERLYRLLPKSDIRTFDDSGHLLFMEQHLDLVTILKATSFYRRTRNLDYVLDYLPPSSYEFRKEQHLDLVTILKATSFYRRTRNLDYVLDYLPPNSYEFRKEQHLDLVTILKATSFYRRTRNLDYVLDYLPPSSYEFRKARESHRFVEEAFSPVMLSTLENGKIVRGLSGIPSEGPVLFVGYHMMLGLELAPLIARIYSERGILVRGIAHPMMFRKSKEGRLPHVSQFDTHRIMGAVPVSPTNLFKLLKLKSHILLYPGGMREALHRKGEEYKLFWPEQSEFVRMAARFGAKIIPFGVVGEDDIGELIFDYEDQMKIPYLKRFIEELSEEAVQLRSNNDGEVGKQDVHLPVMLPKLPGRFYYLFGKPIETQGREKELRKRDMAHHLYVEVKSEVESCLRYLKEKREDDPYRSILSRLLYQLKHGPQTQIPTFEP